MSFSAVGQVFDITTFRTHLAALDLSWARGVTIHHTAFPDLSMRPKGWTIQHMRNLAGYYGGELKWSAGPHLFTDEDQIFGLSPLTARGVHARSFNSHTIGIEALGNYDREDPTEGRGKEVWNVTAAATAAILCRLDLNANDGTIHFHRDDPHTSKSCPGHRVIKQHFIGAVLAHLNDFRQQGDPADRHTPKLPTVPASEPDDLDPQTGNIAAARECLKKALALLG